MLFNSFDFILFFPIVVLIYFLVPQKYKWIILLVASYYFYMSWKLDYIILIIVSTLIDYWAGLRMGRDIPKYKKKKYLILSFISNLGLLFTFKYFNFFSDSLYEIFNSFNIFYNKPEFQLLLPVGISFYTFQTLSYSIEVYNGKQKPERHLGIFALYVSFFPQLVAGPIERFSNLGNQFKQKHYLTWSNLSNGLRLILFGLFVKMVVADNLGDYVDVIYKNPADYNSLSVLYGLFFYSFQIYADFFGYSTVAIGTAKILGINLMDNFKTPYLSLNLIEFWKRWHISLSTWFRDYLYIPLGGNRVKVSRWYFNIFVVFAVSGLWHGANWTFVVWGVVHGLVLVYQTFISGKNKYLSNYSIVHPISIFRILLNFLLVSFIWIFFRSENFDKAMLIIKSVVGNFSVDNYNAVSYSLFTIFSLFVLSDIVLYNNRYDKYIDSKNIYLRWVSYFILLAGILMFASLNEQPFIYFQF